MDTDTPTRTPVREATSLSDDHQYRYALEVQCRDWARSQPTDLWIVNQAGRSLELAHDRVAFDLVRRSHLWGVRRTVVGAIFAYVGPGPLEEVEDPAGRENIPTLIEFAARPGTRVICAWGVLENLRLTAYADALLDQLERAGHPLWCMGVTPAGACARPHPTQPWADDLRPRLWSPVRQVYLRRRRTGQIRATAA